MTIIPRQTQKWSKKSGFNLWCEKSITLLALINLILVFFDLKYISLRDFWLHGRVQLLIKIGRLELELPQEPLKILPFRVTDWYDWVKGIEPQRDTKQYLKLVEDLENRVNQVGLPNLDDKILKDLRDRSVEMIETNPFLIADKTGTLARIKNKMRLHVFGTKEASAKEAFRIFWSREYLTQKGVEQELNFFDRQIKPLIETNYFRPVGENGESIDNFGLIDLPFSIIFVLNFLAGTWYISRRRTGVSWTDAMLWRWYDIFLFIPFFRWLRVIPVTIRLDQAELINLSKIKIQIIQGFVAGIAKNVAEVVIVQIISQSQESIRRGEIDNLLSQGNAREYINLNGINETAEIAKLMAQLTVYQAIPKIQPDLEALLQHSIDKIMHQSPAYQVIQQFPGVEKLRTNLSKQLAQQIYQSLYDTLNSLLEEDPVFLEILEHLVANFSEVMGSEIQAKQSIKRIESLLVTLLEKIKINYVEGLSAEDIEEILEQTRVLHQRNFP
ncbi:MAG: hypothetical protein AB4426_10565 [Xenococcaceae cyanobacterium]